jgi:alpha-1,6-mannosyltransferase
VKICDLTQFYSPLSGGVKRYVSEKVRYVRERTPADEHVLIIPGDRDGVSHSDRSRVYTVRSPLISRTSQYRALVRLRAVERVLEQERPDLIESGDPYQLAWKAVFSGAALGIPVVGFYHSHFPEAYLRSAQKFLGRAATEFSMGLARRYVRQLYNRFERTLVPAPALAELLKQWGVENLVTTDLGVDAVCFRPQPEPGENLRAEMGIPAGPILLLYVGRLAQEKNTHTLFQAFRLLHSRRPGRFQMLVVGDGLQRTELQALQGDLSDGAGSPVHWMSYCEAPERLARIYRGADLFVHPGVQETFGLVTLEAQACGTPVLGIRGSYMDRIVQSDQTLWARENSAEALAAAIDETVRQPAKTDPLALHARVASQYGWPEVFGRLFEIYREVVRDFARRPPKQ